MFDFIRWFVLPPLQEILSLYIASSCKNRSLERELVFYQPWGAEYQQLYNIKSSQFLLYSAELEQTYSQDSFHKEQV